MSALCVKCSNGRCGDCGGTLLDGSPCGCGCKSIPTLEARVAEARGEVEDWHLVAEDAEMRVYFGQQIDALLTAHTALIVARGIVLVEAERWPNVDMPSPWKVAFTLGIDKALAALARVGETP